MSKWTSSLRPGRAALVTSACLAVLSAPCAAWGASGTPAPVPDDPPAGATFTTTRPSGTTRPATTTRSARPVRQATQSSSVPTPDAPPGSNCQVTVTEDLNQPPQPPPLQLADGKFTAEALPEKAAAATAKASARSTSRAALMRASQRSGRRRRGGGFRPRQPPAAARRRRVAPRGDARPGRRRRALRPATRA